LKFADLLDVGLLELELIEDTLADENSGGIDDACDSATTDAS